MEDPVRRAVERSLAAMRENLAESLTVDDLARSAMFSKFHYSRLFRRTTGVSPAQFLAALRLTEAKRLLLTTGGSVADISHQVGYNSVGTFSTRFTTSVGAAPTVYRRSGGRVPGVLDEDGGGDRGVASTVRGQLTVPRAAGPVFIGVFPGRITEGKPARCALLTGPGTYALSAVPEGTWHVVAHAATAPGTDGPDRFVGHAGPLTTRPGVAASIADLRLRPAGVFDPPVLLALPDLRAQLPSNVAKPA
ncbi:helix-turn-helix domain-containing protein [Amycolatopsis sp. NPDC098790]|uniref:helix-turn-helix domain-containing protein n=1 Tax=Amycolatopsis sp. NPDC098790 TaxID=3363939 RepID=UPI003810FF0B